MAVGWCAVLIGGGACSFVAQRWVEPAPGSPPRTEIERLLASVRVIAERPDVPGYDRSCKPGDGCVFGAAWSDDTAAPLGHDGCDTRNNVLGQQLSAVEFKKGTRDCVVLSGRLADPYSGQEVPFRRSDAIAVQIDHVFPLAAAWDLGAAQWPIERRMAFANDVEVNLLAVTGSINKAKGDGTPARWLPPNPAYHCFYAGKYLTAAVRYGLPVTDADRNTLRKIAARCG